MDSASTHYSEQRHAIAEKLMDAARRRDTRRPRHLRPGPVWGLPHNARWAPILGRLLSNRCGVPCRVWLASKDPYIEVGAIMGQGGGAYTWSINITTEALRDTTLRLRLLKMVLGYLANSYHKAVSQ